MIVHSSGPVVLVGGAQFDPTDLNIFQSFAPQFVGVDAGADHLLAAGIDPVAVIGDLDSLSDHARAAFPERLCHVKEQDTVDFEKAVDRVSAPVIFAVGFSGGRLDHTLAVLHVMGRNLGRAIVLIGPEDVAMIVPKGGVVLDDLPIGSQVSLMPLEPAKVTASGLRWPVNKQPMAPLGFTSPSNMTDAPRLQIETEGAVLLILAKVHLTKLAQAVMG